LKGFATIDEARKWIHTFVELYNTEFLHSGIKFVTPHQRHTGKDIEILSKRDEVYKAARQKNLSAGQGKQGIGQEPIKLH
jgi:hypothetical protein